MSYWHPLSLPSPRILSLPKLRCSDDSLQQVFGQILIPVLVSLQNPSDPTLQGILVSATDLASPWTTSNHTFTAWGNSYPVLVQCFVGGELLPSRVLDSYTGSCNVPKVTTAYLQIKLGLKTRN